MALSSTSSITRFTTVTDTGDPIAVPKVCWKYSPQYAIYVASRQNLSSWITSCSDSVVRSSNKSSLWRSPSATQHDNSTGTFVKSDTISNETRTASSMIVWSEMNLANSIEFLTKDGVLPTNGDRRQTKCLGSW